MAEHDGLTRAPVLVVNLDAVFCRDRRHGALLFCRHSGTRVSVDPESRDMLIRDSGFALRAPRNDEIESAEFHAGLNRRHAPMIIRTKNTSTMPWTTANTGPDGGLPGATAVSAGILRKLWITSTNTLK